MGTDIQLRTLTGLKLRMLDFMVIAIKPQATSSLKNDNV